MMEYWIYLCVFMIGIFSSARGFINTRAILLITNGSSLQFDDLWMTDSLNDPHNNKSSELDFLNLLNGGDFKSTIDPVWGEPMQFRFHLVNEVGPIKLAEFSLDVYGTNISNLSEWLTADRFLYDYSTPPMSASVIPTVRDGNQEVILRSNSSGLALFSIVHEPDWPTALLLARNSSYFFNTSALGNISEPVSGSLVNYSFSTLTSSVVITPSDFPWEDDFFYMTGIQVDAQDNNLETVNYTLALMDNSSGVNQFQGIPNDGLVFTFPTMLAVYLNLTFDSPVENFTVTLFGPTDTPYIVAAALYVYGLFDNSSTTSTLTTPTPTSTSVTTTLTTPTPTSTSTTLTTPTSTSTTTTLTTQTTTTTTTSMPTSTTTPPTTSVGPTNSSILINGTWYCPCVTPINTSNTTDSNQTLTEIVAEIVANLTIDKSTLSSNTRKYISAEDNRPSAKTLGAVGVIIIAIVMSSVVYIDGATLVKEMTKIRKNYKRLKKRLSKWSLKVEDMAPATDEDIKMEVQDVNNSEDGGPAVPDADIDMLDQDVNKIDDTTPVPDGDVDMQVHDANNPHEPPQSDQNPVT